MLLLSVNCQAAGFKIDVMKYFFLSFFVVFSNLVMASDSHSDVREIFQQNQILPLAEILPDVEKQLNARLLEAELEREHGRYVYELEMITADGRMIEVMVDAATGTILEVEQEGWAGKED